MYVTSGFCLCDNIRVDIFQQTIVVPLKSNVPLMREGNIVIEASSSRLDQRISLLPFSFSSTLLSLSNSVNTFSPLLEAINNNSALHNQQFYSLTSNNLSHSVPFLRTLAKYSCMILWIFGSPICRETLRVESCIVQAILHLETKEDVVIRGGLDIPPNSVGWNR